MLCVNNRWLQIYTTKKAIISVLLLLLSSYMMMMTNVNIVQFVMYLFIIIDLKIEIEQKVVRQHWFCCMCTLQ